MKHIQKNAKLPCNSLILDKYFNENCIFFDIETTGFSPSSSMCYLIGTLGKDDNGVIVDQYLACDKNDEKDIILAFLNTIKNKSTIITFNGMGFDLPFIQAKCKSYGISFDFVKYQYIDIFKLVSEMKFLLKLQNYKQKTIEHFLGIQRDDLYSGGELISIYEEYILSQSKELEALLLLHNYEDVVGMLDILPILTYREILKGAYTLENAICQSYMSYEGETEKELIITLKNHYSVPCRVSHQFGDFYITMMDNHTKIRVTVYDGTLRYFFPNYKDYFYLPIEDMAIHKSVATYVDNKFRQKAKANNCYTKKSALFLPQLEEINSPAFRREYKDKLSFFEYTEEFLESDEMVLNYIDHILKKIQ